MVTIPGYQIVEKLHESSRALVFRGLREGELDKFRTSPIIYS